MKEKYHEMLLNLMTLSDEEYEAIPECRPEVVTQHDTTLIASTEQRWLYDLCKSVSPNQENSAKAGRLWPRYIPKQTIKVGGEGFLLTAEDRWRKIVVLLKIPLPIFSTKGKKKETGAEIEAKNAGHREIIRGSKAMLKLGRDLYRPPTRKISRKLKAIDRKHPSNLELSEDVRRFKHSFMLQQQIHGFITQGQNKNNLPPLGYPISGYVPDVYDFGEPPCCFYSQEYIENAISFLESIRTSSDKENMVLFLKITKLIETKIHGYGVAHCDLAPRNIIVIRQSKENIPVLLDFGIAKAEQLPEITLQSAQLGSLLFSSGEQMRNSQYRGYLDDVHSLAKILWVVKKRETPSLYGVLVRIGSDGKRNYDEETVMSKFEKSELPEEFWEIFDKALTFQYNDISEFRIELERILYFNKQLDGYNNDSIDVAKIKKFLEKMIEIYEENF